MKRFIKTWWHCLWRMLDGHRMTKITYFDGSICWEFSCSPELEELLKNKHMTQEESRGWEKEFDKGIPQIDEKIKSLALYDEGRSEDYEFGYYVKQDCEIFEVVEWPKIKLFIKNLLSQRESELIKRIEEMMPKETKKHWVTMEGRHYDKGFNKCREIILKGLYSTNDKEI